MADLGAFSAGKSSVDSILIPRQVKRQGAQIAMMPHAVRKNRASSRKSIVLVDIIHIAKRDFKHACVLHGEGYALNASGRTCL